MKNILIATHQRGFESDPIIDELRKKEVNVFRFNFDDGDNVSLCSFSTKKNEISYTCDTRNILDNEISVGWCQQLPPYIGYPSNQKEALQRQNIYSLQMATLNLLDISWFNKPKNVEFASNKVNQLYFAERFTNLLVPKTLVSNNPNDIRSFSKNRKIIAKNLSTPWIFDKNKIKAAHTMIVNEKWLLDDEALSLTPVIYQEYCKRAKDFRVIIVGEKVFAAECIPDNNQMEDIRRGSKTGESFKPCGFNKEIIKELKVLMNIFSIEYCAADFMEDEKGNIFFLEVNTCGSWWWMDRFYNGMIRKSITEEILKKGWS